MKSLATSKVIFITAFFLIFVAISFLFSNAYLNIAKSQSDAKEFTRLVNTIDCLRSIKLDVKNTESGLREYILTNSPKFLQNYISGLSYLLI
jgi:CHASE3 domain sensor protein